MSLRLGFEVEMFRGYVLEVGIDSCIRLGGKHHVKIDCKSIRIKSCLAFINVNGAIW